MALSKVRESRVFRAEWTEKYVFVLPAVSSTRPPRLIAVVKSGNLKRHYETKHRHFEDSYPQQSESEDAENKQAPSPVWAIYAGPLSFPLRPIANIRVFRWEYTGFWEQHLKPFTDGSIVKEHECCVRNTSGWKRKMWTDRKNSTNPPHSHNSHKTHINVMRGSSVTARCC